MSEDEKNIIWGIIQSINELWTKGLVEPLGEYYDDNVIHVNQDYNTITDTKEALLKSYKSFCDNAKVNSFTESEQTIEIVGATAIVSYTWSIQYEMNEKSYDEKGKELLVFAKETGKWLIVWRMLVPDKS